MARQNLTEIIRPIAQTLVEKIASSVHFSMQYYFTAQAGPDEIIFN